MGLAISTFVMAQDDYSFVKADIDGGIGEYFYPKLKYPIHLLENDIQGRTILDFRINKEGKLDSIHVVSSFDISVLDQAVELLMDTKDRWSPTLVNNEPVDYMYKIVFEYRIRKSIENKAFNLETIRKKTKKLLKKEEYEKVLKLINDFILLEPFHSEILRIRSGVYDMMNLEEESLLDLIEADKIDKKVMADIKITAY